MKRRERILGDIGTAELLFLYEAGTPRERQAILDRLPVPTPPRANTLEEWADAIEGYLNSEGTPTT